MTNVRSKLYWQVSTPTLFHFRIQRASFDENFYSAEKTLIQKWEDGEIDLNGAFFLQIQIHNSVLCFHPLYPIQKAEKTPVHFPESLSLFCVWLTWPQEEVYQLRHGWRLQGIWLCGLEDMALQWKGRSCLWSLMSKHWTSRDLTPPSQFLVHWEKTWHDWYSNTMSYDFVVSLQGLVRLCGFSWVSFLVLYPEYLD